MKRLTRGKRRATAAVFALTLGTLVCAAVALADNVVNDVASNPGSDTFTAGGSTTVGYRIVEAVAGDSQAGCNAADGSPATVNIQAPSGVTASPSSLSFNYCGNPAKTVQFSSATPGDYEIAVSVTDSGGASGYRTNPATFTLHVLEDTNPPANNPPTIDSFSVGGTNCDPEVEFTASDPDDDDLNWSLDWDDGSTPDSGSGPSPLDYTATGDGPISHHYSSAGQHDIELTVDDGDLNDTAAELGYTVYNEPSGVLQPINGTGPRSLFKAGSTIPVKITVADCDGGSVDTLAPQVEVRKLDGTPDGTVVESTSPANPTPGTTMRYDALAPQYIYNLGTKGYASGDYKITISDPSFAAPVEATISLKK